MTTTLDVAFRGTAEEKKLGAAMLDLMRGHGRFIGAEEPIRVSAESLAAALAQQGKQIDADRVLGIVKKNAEIFATEERDEVTLIVTTRNGRPPALRSVDLRHTFSARFMTPLPKPELPPEPPRERPRVAQQWGDIAHLVEQFAGLSTERPHVPPVDGVVVEHPIAADEVEIAASAPSVEAAEPPVEEPVTARVLRVPATAPSSFTHVEESALVLAVTERLREDSRVANFADHWMLEERVPRFSRGDLRRLREYIQEQEQPLTDELLVQDVLGGRPGTQDFELLKFAVNFRLSREHREFDFVGTPGQRFWSTSTLPPIGTTRRKANEIGTDYRHLLDETPPDAGKRSVKSVDHVLTFYESYLGLLPFDGQMQRLLPGPVLPNQRTAVLTFECPQSYTTYLVELRYPTPNRGGFILGLDDFYNENLVPGALMTIEATENDGHYIVRYIEAPTQSARLLELEERRQRYVFRPTTFACGVVDEYVISEERFPNFSSEKPLEERVRRRPEAAIASAFERIGRRSDGPGFVAGFDELMAVANVERPFSERYLRSILETDESGAFARDPDGNDAYTYVPGNPT